MPFDNLGGTLARVLPKIKTPLQLSGAAIIVVGSLAMHFAQPGNNVAMLTVGGVGVGFLVFGQLFSYLKDFREIDRPLVFLVSFVIFCLFIVTMVFLVVRVTAGPTMKISPYSPSGQDPPQESHLNARPDELYVVSFIATAAAAATQPADPLHATNIPLAPYEAKDPNLRDARDADYKYSEPGGVPTLRAALGYTEQAREGLYPDADFHEAVSWGSPWISLDISNPGQSNLFLDQLQIDADRIEPINDVIINTGESDADHGPVVLKLENFGWGRATDPHLMVAFATQTREGDHRTAHRITDWHTFAMQDFDKGANVNIDSVLPKHALWEKLGESCYGLTVLARLDYKDESLKPQTRTFRTSVSSGQCGGGGNIFPDVYFNIQLPELATEFPLHPPIADCIGPNSAGRFVIQFTARRSARYQLRLAVKSTSNVVLSSKLDVDVLVPRGASYYVTKTKNKTYVSKATGCT